MWDRSFEQLKCYKKLNGHCVVGRADGEEYSVLKRARRAAFGSGKLSEERIQALNELGFEWVAPRGRKKKSYQRQPRVKKQLQILLEGAVKRLFIIRLN